MENRSPYKKSKNLLTKTEADFYVYLKAAVNNDFHINKMTRMCDLVDVDKSLSGKEYMSYFRSISQYHIDFTLCDPITFKPVICIELDDPSHERDDRIKRDEKVNKIFADINLPLLRIKTERKYNVENLRSLIYRNIRRDDGEYLIQKIDSTERENSFDVNIPIDEIDQESVGKFSKPMMMRSDQSDLLLKIFVAIICLIIIPIFVKHIAFKTSSIINKKTTPHRVNPNQNKFNVPKFNTPYPELKQSSEPQRKPVVKEYTIDDVKISSTPGTKPTQRITATNSGEVEIKPIHYSGRFTLKMVWEGNYKSGNGIIALLDCGAQWMLIEQLASGIQLEHSVKKQTKGSHVEFLPLNDSSSTYYVISSNGSLQQWDSVGMINEFKRRS